MIHRATEIISFALFLMISLTALGLFALGRSEEVKNGAVLENLFNHQKTLGAIVKKQSKTQSLSTVLDADLHRLAITLSKMGYAIVPKQPTREMVLAGMMARGAQTAYAEMINNAPKIAGA